jgi:hypothetical protein
MMRWWAVIAWLLATGPAGANVPPAGAFACDSVGHRLARAVTGGVLTNQSHSFDANDRLSAAGLTYDASGNPRTHGAVAYGYGPLGDELLHLLRSKNGFYAFESALHVFPAASFENEMTLSRWNSFGLWRHEYGELADRKLFFAEDAFGNQFCLHGGNVCSFDAETGATETLGEALDDWAKRVLADYEILTGQPLLHRWQAKHGGLPRGTRLMPKVPFVLGGEYALSNLCTIAAVSGMKTRGNLARQIKGLPNGAQVEFRIIE